MYYSNVDMHILIKYTVRVDSLFHENSYLSLATIKIQYHHLY